MDWDNLSAMQQQCPKAYQHKLMLLMRFANEFEEATVPDPYYGGADGFGKVLDYGRRLSGRARTGPQARHSIPAA